MKRGNSNNRLPAKIIRLQNQLFVDFNHLAQFDPALRSIVLILDNRTVINFKKQQNLIILARAIMNHIFFLQWDCPFSNLCPRIPSRYNYLVWVKQNAGRSIRRVLDIGTGATLVYPLLGVKNFNWKFVATEICQKSYQHAQMLKDKNKMNEMIDLRLARKESKHILLDIIKLEEAIDVVICNPPFFESAENTISVMKQNEHHFEGGQYGFFFQIYRQSYWYDKIEIFTCLIGRKTDFYVIKTFLQREKDQGMVEQIGFGEIVQGNNSRYIVKWRIFRSSQWRTLKNDLQMVLQI